MKQKFLPLLLFTALLSVSCNTKNDIVDPLVSTEKLLLLGNVITIDTATPRAEAIVVENGQISFVGSQAEARKMCDAKTIVKDYGTASIYPGFTEGHTHGSLAAARFMQADLTEINAKVETVMADFVEAMKKYMQEHPGLSIYKGSGWLVKDCEPNAEMLDAICPDVPMVLNSEDGHSMWLNTKALTHFGFDKEAVKKYGEDCIRVDSEGNPTGFISENPAIELLDKIAPDKKECREGLLMWQQKAFSQGITAVTEAAVGLSNPLAEEVYQELCDEGVWKLRTYAVKIIDESVPDEKLDSALNRVLALRNKYNSEYYKVTGTKVFMDGVIEAHTGWLEEEYSDDPGYYGLKRCPDPNRVARIVAFNNKNGMNVHFHSIGDAATNTAIKGIVQAQAETGIKDGRNAIAHLQIVKPEVFKKMADNNIIPIVAPLWLPKYPDEYPIYCRYIGDRADTEYPIKSFYDAGCLVNFHSDYPASNSFSMAQTIYIAITRTSKEYGPETLHNPAECITRQQALEAMTINVPYQWHEENRMGSITPGKLANFAIYDTDFLQADPDAIWDAKIKATYVDGNVVYGE